MAQILSSAYMVKVGTTSANLKTFAVTSFSLSRSQDQQEVTTTEDTDRKYIGAIKTFTMNFACFNESGADVSSSKTTFEELDSLDGETIYFSLTPTDATKFASYSGSGVWGTKEMSGEVSAPVGRSLDIQGSGALTETYPSYS